MDKYNPKNVKEYTEYKAKVAMSKQTEDLMAKMLPDDKIEMPTWGVHFPGFVKALTERLHIGQIDYGDKSFSKDLQVLLVELEQEVLDAAVYSFVTWTRIESLKSAIRTILGGADELGDVLVRDSKERSDRE